MECEYCKKEIDLKTDPRLMVIDDDDKVFYFCCFSDLVLWCQEALR